MMRGCVRLERGPAALLALSLLVAELLAPGSACALVPSTAPPPGIREKTPAVFALTNARIVMAPGRVLSKGTIVVRDGIVVAVGSSLKPPADAVVRDLAGKTVYPGLFDAYTSIGIGAPSPSGPGAGGSAAPAAPPSGPGTPELGGTAYWNPLITPQMRVSELFEPDSVAAKTLRDQGVTTVVSNPSRGLIKGTSAVVQLGTGDPNRLVLAPEAALDVAITVAQRFDDGGGYPNSPMGAYTLVRQALYDADWYGKAWAAWNRERRLARPEANQALEALAPWPHSRKPVVIEANDEASVLRADRLGKEFGLNVIVRGSGREYRRLDLVRATGRAILVPVNFPKAPDVSSPDQTMAVELEDLLQWDFAPENPARLVRAGVPIALTSDGLKDKTQFLKMVRLAVERGLDRDAALAALTVTPASLFGLSDKLGTIDPGKLANFVLTDGDLFAKKTRVLETWVEGRSFEVVRDPSVDPRGTWRVDWEGPRPPGMSIGGPTTLTLEGEPGKLSGKLKTQRDVKLKSAEVLASQLLMTFPADSLGGKGAVRISGTVSGDAMVGTGEWPDGGFFRWTASRTAPFVAPPDTSKTPPVEKASFEVTYPFGAFGRKKIPDQPATVVFRGATVWTCGRQGRIENGTVIVRHGKIAAVGRNLSVPSGAVVVDATGKQLTPGIIDCHSHTATDGGINEAGQTVSAEVRIGDFIEADDINIYRQLAGGVTAAHVLHGSANTIGGQCQLVKYRWGMGPEEMKFEGYRPTIKFALGENVKQSNWGDRFTTRYPQTRMGVEQLVRDEFQAAREYEKAWAAWNAHHQGLPPRRDLELDAISEVLDGKRMIHCHSYRQDEILGLMKVCDDYGVHIACFQHILEGYKVAPEMAKRGITGSTFSDWWAYKIEVQDAIPYNGALMHDAGVIVSYNSDSDELARRLNTEAGKAVKYGGVSEEEALDFVTINPAKQLYVDKRVGSIEPGKDADLALWNVSPLASTSVCEQTWVDGRKYFDRDEDLRMRTEVEKMRATLIQKAIRLADRDDGRQGADRKPPVIHVDLYDAHSSEGEDQQ